MLYQTQCDSKQTIQEPAAWKTIDPPKDGTNIVAVGRIIESDEFSTAVIPFCAAIHWEKDRSNYEGWHTSDGMSFARTLEEKIIVDYWLEHPYNNSKS